MEGVSTPEEFDIVWLESSGGSASPCRMMNAVGLDTGTNIEGNYIHECKLGTHAVEYLRKNYAEKGALGAQSSKGGLYLAGATSKTREEEPSHHDSLYAPTL